MAQISFRTKLSTINSTVILQLPAEASTKLPSKGMVMVNGTINGLPIQTALEPDGKGGHWFKIDQAIVKKINAKTGDNVELDIEPTKNWPDPQIPDDLKIALNNNPNANSVWVDTTPIARWDWIRWINSTKNPETRKKRISVACSKLESGMRRPCCFNRAMCTDPNFSNNGILLDQA